MSSAFIRGFFFPREVESATGAKSRHMIDDFPRKVLLSQH